MSTTVSFTDLGTSSEAFVVLRRLDDGLALGFGVEADGDLDLVVGYDDASRIADAIVAALESA